MNRGLDQPLDELLDRLVDGELTNHEYRELLTALDAQPDGWRRCAMAFLESQALGKELHALRAEPSPRADRTPSPRDWKWNFGSLLTLASAASFLLAFLVAAQVFRPDANRNNGNRSLPNGGLTTVAPNQNFPDAVNRSMGNGFGGNSSLPNGTDAEGVGQPWGEYRLVVEGKDGQPKQIEMPILSVDDPRAEQLLADDRSTMPVDLIRALQRMGHQVNRQREWAPVKHESGDVLVPIEQLQITPVSSRSYQ